MNVTEIPLSPDKRHPTGLHKYTTDFVIRTESRHQGQVTRFGVGYVAPDEEDRKEFQGPMVPGPWAYLFPLATVIDNHGGTAAESRRLREQGLEVDLLPGAIVKIDGFHFRLEDKRRFYNPTLTLID